VERAQGRAPNLGMREHHIEVSQAFETNLHCIEFRMPQTECGSWLFGVRNWAEGNNCQSDL
jgi:hypothetical protein